MNEKVNQIPPSRLRRWRVVVGIIAVGVALGIVIWILVFQHFIPGEKVVGLEVAIILAPVIAAAAAIERTLETIFDLVETQGRKIMAFLARTEIWIEDAEKEVEEARSLLVRKTIELNKLLEKEILKEGATTEAIVSVEKETKENLEIFKHQVDRAENLLASVTTKSPTYRQAKRLVSLFVSFILGLVIAWLGSVQMLHLLGIFPSDGPAFLSNIDVLITGVVMATGSGPVHSLINILQQGKEALENVSGFLDSRKGHPPQASATGSSTQE